MSYSSFFEACNKIASESLSFNASKFGCIERFDVACALLSFISSFLFFFNSFILDNRENKQQVYSLYSVCVSTHPSSWYPNMLCYGLTSTRYLTAFIYLFSCIKHCIKVGYYQTSGLDTCMVRKMIVHEMANIYKLVEH